MRDVASCFLWNTLVNIGPIHGKDSMSPRSSFKCNFPPFPTRVNRVIALGRLPVLADQGSFSHPKWNPSHFNIITNLLLILICLLLSRNLPVKRKGTFSDWYFHSTMYIYHHRWVVTDYIHSVKSKATSLFFNFLTFSDLYPAFVILEDCSSDKIGEDNPPLVPQVWNWDCHDRKWTVQNKTSRNNNIIKPEYKTVWCRKNT